MSELTFDSDSHTYRFGGQVVPSVTQLLDRLHSFAGVDKDVLEAAKRRGTYVHRMCELFDLAELDIGAVPQKYAGYLAAWEEFSFTYGPQWEGIEERAYSKAFGFAGTRDRNGRLARRFPSSTRWIVDIKTSEQSHPVWGIQTAAYRQLCMERDAAYAESRRATVQLRADGTYRFITWDEPSDWPAFLSLINLSNWSMKCLK